MPMFSLDFGYRKSCDSRSRSFSHSNSDDDLRGSLKKAFGQPHYKSAVEASGKLDFGELELELWDSRYMLRGQKEPKWTGWCKPSCIPISIILVLIILVVTLSLLDQKWEDERSKKQAKLEQQWAECRNTCQIGLVESIPEGVSFNTTWKHPSTYDSWKTLIDLAEETIEIGSYYWTLQGDHPTAEEGKDIFNRLMKAGTRKKKKINIKIAQNIGSSGYPNIDTQALVDAKAATVRSLNFSSLELSGILHTKMWLVDRKHIYIGSANFDWRSLTQVKELGFLATNCSCLGGDLGKIFDVYWYLGKPGNKIPTKWPTEYQTLYGRENPMKIAFNGTKYNGYLSSSPPSFCPQGRTTDLDAIFDVIDNATEFVHIAVMDYEPVMVFRRNPLYWPEIDNRLRKAAIDRKVQVRLLIAEWNHTSNSTFNFLDSLQDLNNVYPDVDIDIKFFVVPSTPDQAHIPFARVNHNKYMVTDQTAYIGTSNWSGDYFVATAGVGFIVTPDNSSALNTNESNFRFDLAKVFERDWNSDYTHTLQQYKLRQSK